MPIMIVWLPGGRVYCVRHTEPSVCTRSVPVMPRTIVRTTVAEAVSQPASTIVVSVRVVLKVYRSGCGRTTCAGKRDTTRVRERVRERESERAGEGELIGDTRVEAGGYDTRETNGRNGRAWEG